MRTVTRSWYVLLLLLILLSPFRAEAAPWTPIGPFGGIVRALAVSSQDPRILYAGTEGAGVFRSANGGRTWQARNEGLTQPIVLALAIDPRDPDTVFAGTERGLFASTDGGASWSGPHQDLACSLGSCSLVTAVVIDPARPRTLYATADLRVFHSTDGGATWRERSAGLPQGAVTTLALDPRTPRILYAGTRSDGVYKTTDGGATWRPANQGFLDDDVSAIAVDPRSPRTVYAGTDEASGLNLWKSTDGGATWRAVSSGFRGPEHRVLALAIDPAAPQTLYAGTRGGLFWSTDGGRSWRSRSGAGSRLAAFGVSALAVHPTATSVLWAGTGTAETVPPLTAGRPGAGVFRSPDRGASWTPSRQGMSATDVRSLALAPPAAPAPALYAGTGGLGVFRGTRQGPPWESVSQALPGSGVETLLVHPRNPAILYAGTEAGVFRSADGGATWVSRSLGLGAPPRGLGSWILTLAFQPGNPDVLFAGTWNGFYKSTDAGASWRTVIPFAVVWSIAVSEAAPGVVYIASSSRGDDPSSERFCRSDNDATTFVLCQNLGVLQVAADPRDARVVLIGTVQGGLQRSTDGGATFTEVGFEDLGVRALLFDPFAPGTVYAAVQDISTLEAAVARSRDGGATWEPLDGRGLGTDFLRALAVDAAGTLYAGTAERGILRSAGAR